MDCYDTKACCGNCDECEIFKKEFENDLKIELINSIHGKVIDYDCDGEICHSVICLMDNEVENVLKKLGKSDEWIEKNVEVENGGFRIDLTLIGFEFANWWDSEEGFSQPKETN